MIKRQFKFQIRFVRTSSPPFVTKYGVVIRHNELECHAKILGCCLQGQGPCKYSRKSMDLLPVKMLDFCVHDHCHSEGSDFSSCLSGRHLLNRGTFCYETWFGDIDHNKVAYHARKETNKQTPTQKGRCVQGQNSWNQNLTFYHVLIVRVVIMGQSVLWNNLIVVVKVRITVMMLKNVTESFVSVLYFLYHWYLCNQTRHVDVAITKANANKLGI